jgi:CRP/FNR family cyclic AMP-dependent transcriptional regulator
LNHTEQKRALKRTRIFEKLSDEAHAEIAQLVHWKEYRKGVEAVSYKDTGKEVYFLAEGRVRATIFSFSGKEISYQELSPGSMFGELSAIDGQPRTANVITMEPSLIGSISGKDLWTLIHKYPEVSAGVLQRLAALVRFLSDRVYQYGALDVKDRVRAEVLRLARENMTDGKSATVSKMPTHAEIANRINTHREAVTRELNELSRLGIVDQNKRVLTIADVGALAELLPEDI